MCGWAYLWAWTTPFFLEYLLPAAAASATVFFVAVRAVLIIVLIWSDIITLGLFS
jgi:hypothetical protein